MCGEITTPAPPILSGPPEPPPPPRTRPLRSLLIRSLYSPTLRRRLPRRLQRLAGPMSKASFSQETQAIDRETTAITAWQLLQVRAFRFLSQPGLLLPA